MCLFYFTWCTAGGFETTATSGDTFGYSCFHVFNNSILYMQLLLGGSTFPCNALLRSPWHIQYRDLGLIPSFLPSFFRSCYCLLSFLRSLLPSFFIPVSVTPSDASSSFLHVFLISFFPYFLPFLDWSPGILHRLSQPPSKFFWELCRKSQVFSPAKPVSCKG